MVTNGDNLFIVSVIFKAKMSKAFWFSPLKREKLLFLSLGQEMKSL